MEPSEAVNLLEVVLRDLIRRVLGDDWLARSGLKQDKLEDRRTEEAKRRDGTVLQEDLLAYAHLYELRRAIDRNWDAFQPALGDKKRFTVYLDRAEDFRNAPMHSRELLPFERELLGGIVGEIANKVTIYRSEQGPDDRYYPVIESITDSHGVVAVEWYNMPTGLRLRVGDTVTFRCRGSDPQGRSLTWELYLPPESRDQQEGVDVSLTWRVTESDVSERTSVWVYMASDGQFHRYGQYDDQRQYFYAVEPPY